ncbi:MAG: energy-coupling factor ABC transporter ATP-binding protein [Cellvibrionales bacterium]|nr:energy-coupling factor ABC transporter ATP-binding protein [Cellvibrionales bacterium]
MQCLFECQNIDFHYPQGPLLFNRFNWQLFDGDRLGLIGGNGAGKTTLLHLLMGLLVPQSGSIVAFGKPRAAPQDFTEVRQKAGLLFQDPDDMLFCPTVIEDVAFGPLNQGMDRREAKAHSLKVLEQLNLAHLADRVTHKLSGGEKRLVSLAAVLSMNPEVLLLDEPTTGLDVKAKQRFLDVVETLPQTLVLISHESDVIEQLTDVTFDLAING